MTIRKRIEQCLTKSWDCFDVSIVTCIDELHHHRGMFSVDVLACGVGHFIAVSHIHPVTLAVDHLQLPDLQLWKSTCQWLFAPSSWMQESSQDTASTFTAFRPTMEDVICQGGHSV